MSQSSHFRSVLITGASSGIGAALATVCAAPGVTLSLCGRSEERLAAIAAHCEALGATVSVAVIDVIDRAAVKSWVEDADNAAPLDLIIANAGVSGDTSNTDQDTERERLIRQTKINGVLNTLDAAIPRMTARRAGQVAIMSSLASFRGLPSAPQYAAANAWARSYGEGLRGRLASDGIGVTVICPGFVHSRITGANKFRMPLIMNSGRAAEIILRGLGRNRPRIAFPWIFYTLVNLLAVLPPSLTDRLFAGLPRKE